MSLKSQSAMEYLMTYGWAVLAIAIVIIALFQLGVFGGNNLTPHSTAGACQAVHTAAGSSLAGQCNTGLPKFVAQFKNPSYITIPNPDSYDYEIFTVTAWVNTGDTGYMTLIGREMSTQGWNFLIVGGSESVGIRIDTSTCINCAIYPSSPVLDNKVWHFVVASINLGGSSYIYQDGVQTGASGPFGGHFTQTGGNLNMMEEGQGTGCCTYGDLADVQIYNTTLSQSEITALYNEGIGGAPIDPIHIVGWWPLNGNAQDYSGGSNNGQATNIAYNSTWSSGYVQP